MKSITNDKNILCIIKYFFTNTYYNIIFSIFKIQIYLTFRSVLFFLLFLGNKSGWNYHIQNYIYTVTLICFILYTILRFLIYLINKTFIALIYILLFKETNLLLLNRFKYFTIENGIIIFKCLRICFLFKPSITSIYLNSS